MPAFLHGGDDTIVGTATAPGRSAIAVIRISGPATFDILRRHLSRWPSQPRTAQLTGFLDVHGEQLDQVVVTLHEGPRSFTGEDMAEISTHGGLLVPVTVMSALISSGARQSLPGEFTRRAVLNGKIDLIQAEAIGDLIDSRSSGLQKAALFQLDGGLSRRILDLRGRLIELESLLAYDIDFPEEDDGPVDRGRVESGAGSVLDALDRLLDTARAGELLREGALVVIAGPPNAGKSSLFNALLGQSRAIVTEIPGTTRDAIEGVIEAGGWPVRLVDTAGLRYADDVVERLGIEVSERYLAAADIVLCCAESDAGIDEVEARVAQHSAAARIRVRTKADLVAYRNHIEAGNVPPTEHVSAETGAGLGALLEGIEGSLGASTHHTDPAAGPVLTRVRQKAAVQRARDEISGFLDLWRSGSTPASVAAVHVREATVALEELVGVVDVEDILDVLFSTFCVGK